MRRQSAVFLTRHTFPSYVLEPGSSTGDGKDRTSEACHVLSGLQPRLSIRFLEMYIMGLASQEIADISSYVRRPLRTHSRLSTELRRDYVNFTPIVVSWCSNLSPVVCIRSEGGFSVPPQLVERGTGRTSPSTGLNVSPGAPRKCCHRQPLSLHCSEFVL